MEHDGAGENAPYPIRLQANALAPSPSIYLPPYASSKNSLISNGLISCSQYGLRMFSLMTFQSYGVEQRQD